jgi:hypothetical protein
MISHFKNQKESEWIDSSFLYPNGVGMILYPLLHSSSIFNCFWNCQTKIRTKNVCGATFENLFG